MTKEPLLADAETNERRRLRRAMLLVLMAVVAIVVTGFVFWPQPAPAPELPVAEAIAVEIDLIPTAGGQPALMQRFDQPEVFKPLLEVFNTGREIADHRCPDTGHVAVHLRDGTQWHYGLLSGHDERYYHFRLYDGLKYRIFRVNRAAYADAMQRLGVDRIDDVRPEM